MSILVSRLVDGRDVAYKREGKRWETPFEIMVLPQQQVAMRPLNSFGGDTSIPAPNDDHIIFTYPISQDLKRMFKENAEKWKAAVSGIITPTLTDVTNLHRDK